MAGPMGAKRIDVNTGIDTETQDTYNKASTVLGMLVEKLNRPEHVARPEMMDMPQAPVAGFTELTKLFGGR